MKKLFIAAVMVTSTSAFAGHTVCVVSEIETYSKPDRVSTKVTCNAREGGDGAPEGFIYDKHPFKDANKAEAIKILLDRGYTNLEDGIYIKKS